MQHVADHVDSAYLQQSTPRMLPPAVVLSLAEGHVLRRRLAVLDPWTIVAVLLLLAVWYFKLPAVLLMIPLAALLWRLVHGALWLWRRVRDDVALLRYGQILTAEVQHLRPHRTPLGDVEGALLDCAIAVAPRRTYYGSVWLADGTEALRLSEQHTVAVLCLTRAPGTWRIIEASSVEMRYELMGPMLEVPTD